MFHADNIKNILIFILNYDYYIYIVKIRWFWNLFAILTTIKMIRDYDKIAYCNLEILEIKIFLKCFKLKNKINKQENIVENKSNILNSSHILLNTSLFI